MGDGHELGGVQALRIAGGRFRGLSLKVPKSGDIRPTQESVREALFSMLAGSVPGCRFLDLFSGSGAVGIESVSRGAAHATLVESNPRHIAAIKENLDSVLGEDSAKAVPVRADAYKWLETFVGEPFDIAFADPPYALGESTGYGRVLSILASRNVVATGGYFVAEMTARQMPELPGEWELYRDRKYGKTRLAVWRRMK